MVCVLFFYEKLWVTFELLQKLLTNFVNKKKTFISGIFVEYTCQKQFLSLKYIKTKNCFFTLFTIEYIYIRWNVESSLCYMFQKCCFTMSVTEINTCSIIPDKKRNAPHRTVQLPGRSQVIGQFCLYQCKCMSGRPSDLQCACAITAWFQNKAHHFQRQWVQRAHHF